MIRLTLGQVVALSAVALVLAGCQSGSSSSLTANDLYPKLAEAGVYCDSESTSASGIYSGASEAVCDSSALGRFSVIIFPDRDSMALGLKTGACPSEFSDLTSFGENYFVRIYPPRETLDAVSKALGGKTGTVQDMCNSL